MFIEAYGIFPENDFDGGGEIFPKVDIIGILKRVLNELEIDDNVITKYFLI